jgi:hypothetical protein
MMDWKEALQHWVAFKRGGGIRLEVGVSHSVWLDGLFEAAEHEPFVYIGPDDMAAEEDLTFFSSHDEVEAFVAKLRAAAVEAWGEP